LFFTKESRILRQWKEKVIFATPILSLEDDVRFGPVTVLAEAEEEVVAVGWLGSFSIV